MTQRRSGVEKRTKKKVSNSYHFLRKQTVKLRKGKEIMLRIVKNADRFITKKRTLGTQHLMNDDDEEDDEDDDDDGLDCELSKQTH